MKLTWQRIITEALYACVMTLLVAYVEQHLMRVRVSYLSIAFGILLITAHRIWILRRNREP